MISLLYHSHTVVPAHLAELEAMHLVEPDEQILVAFDGVILDANGQRLSGPTLHDYCLLTSLRMILWARDYGQHLCCAFPLAELTSVEGVGLDPLHAQITMTFAAPDEEEQQFTLALLPLVNLQAALVLMRAASTAARELADHGVDAREAGPEIMAVLSEQIYGHVDGLRPNETPYRWPGAAVVQPTLSPTPAFAHDPASLPPGQIYAAGRLARSAWDTLRRSIREADLPLPFDLNGNSLRELTETIRAINDLVHTVSSSPTAQQMAMAFLNRNNNAQGAPPSPMATADVAAAFATQAWQAQVQSEPDLPAAAVPSSPPPPPNDYHEIPLRRRNTSPLDAVVPVAEPPVEPVQAVQPAVERRQPLADRSPSVAAAPDHREIPLRRRSSSSPTARTFGQGHRTPAMSGSGDAGLEDRASPPEDRRL
ncbi:MAG: hypothetical protein EOM24_16675 [Chloroflexia bacterium]|nr:hypothetical protein [Chloroflexia bacterium]